MNDTLKEVDDALASWFTGLEDRNLSGIVNTIIVSDHGMSSTSLDRAVYIDDIIDMNIIAHVDGWPNYGLWPKDNSSTDALYEALKTHVDSQHYSVYRKEDVPLAFHYSDNDNLAPLWIFPNEEWIIVTHTEVNKLNGSHYKPIGIHGYSNLAESMKAIFFAQGPAFNDTRPVSPFINLEIKDVLLRILGLEKELGKTNGTLNGTLVYLDEPLPEMSVSDWQSIDSSIKGHARYCEH